jgi:hypothetical protein
MKDHVFNLIFVVDVNSNKPYNEKNESASFLSVIKLGTRETA